MLNEVNFLCDDSFEIDVWDAEYELGVPGCVGSRNQKPFSQDFPRNLEIIYFGEDEKICNFYSRYLSALGSGSSEICIDPRLFYDFCKVPKETAKAEEVPESKRQSGYAQAKPTLSYAQIITQALKTSGTGKLTLGEIYAWIEEAFEYYRHANPVWKNSIRHNLSLNKCFKKVPRDPGTRGKGGRWTIDYEFLSREDSKKRRKMHRSKECCTRPTDETPFGSNKPEYLFRPVDILETPKDCDSVDGRDDSSSGTPGDAMSKEAECVRSFMISRTSVKNVNKV